MGFAANAKVIEYRREVGRNHCHGRGHPGCCVHQLQYLYRHILYNGSVPLRSTQLPHTCTIRSIILAPNTVLILVTAPLAFSSGISLSSRWHYLPPGPVFEFRTQAGSLVSPRGDHGAVDRPATRRAFRRRHPERHDDGGGGRFTGGLRFCSLLVTTASARAYVCLVRRPMGGARSSCWLRATMQGVRQRRRGHQSVPQHARGQKRRRGCTIVQDTTRGVTLQCPKSIGFSRLLLEFLTCCHHTHLQPPSAHPTTPIL